MKFDVNKNYCVLSNNITPEFLINLSNAPVIGTLNFKSLVERLSNFSDSNIVFNMTFYGYKDKEIVEVLNLLKEKDIRYINVTPNIEEAIFSDEIVVYDNEDVVLSGKKEEVLKEEKTLKKLGYGLPFAVDLSLQLNYYDILKELFYNVNELVDELWN